MLKRFLCFSLAIGIFSGSLLGVLAFGDVPSNHIHFDAVQYARLANIVNGYSDGTFKPDRIVTRGEFTKIIVRALFDGNQIDACQSKVFPDVDQSSPFFSVICFSESKGIVSGYSSGLFKPEDNVSVGQAAKIVSNAYGFTNISDSPDFMVFLKELEKRKSLPAEIYSVDSNITRSQMVEVIYRLNNEITSKPSSSLTDVDTVVSGSYEEYSQSVYSKAENGDVVLFFHASWCPFCVQLDSNLNSSNIPDGLTIAKVDYDSESALKSKYGVTSQHTLVEVDSNGNEIKKWLGSNDLEAILKHSRPVRTPRQLVGK